IPCETVYSTAEIQSVMGLVGDPSGLLCRDLADRGAGFGEAVAYWVRAGAPERMDADGNGIPCETVYDAREITGFIWFDR
ncbi:MAG: excalibur calcium-binding domain-containing protein, partial [Acidimicrobiia bacterium]